MNYLWIMPLAFLIIWFFHILGKSFARGFLKETQKHKGELNGKKEKT